MKRRQFLGVSASGIALALVPMGFLALGEEHAPRLWGDGIHDDTYAIQWRMERSTVENPFVLQKGTFAVNRASVN